MRSVLVLTVLAVVLGVGFVGVNLVFAEIDSLDIVVENERVKISGTAEPNSRGSLNIWDESGELVIERLMVVDLDGIFNFSFGEKHLQGIGTFTGEITHEDIIEKFEFETTERAVQQTQNALDIQMNDNDQIQLVPVTELEKLQERNLELETENEQLRKENISLKDQIVRMTNDFMNTVNQLNSWFQSQLEK